MGDFGFTFHVQELAVCAANKIPVVVVVVNNAYLGLIRQNQKYAYGYECDVAMPENQELIDYVKVAEGFACYAERVFNPQDIGPALQRAVQTNHANIQRHLQTLAAGGYVRREGRLCHFTPPRHPLAKALLKFLPE